MKFYKKFSLFIFLLLVLLTSASFVLALEVTYPDIMGRSLNENSTITDFVCYIFGFLMSLTTAIAGITIAYGGILYIISFVKGSFTSEAIEIMKAGITGFLLIISSVLIANTINPALTRCENDVLSAINLNWILDENTTSPSTLPGVPLATYQEIPIGSYVETLLTRTMDCYGFDLKGDPIDGDKESKDTYDLTYKNHDRIDCLTQLMEGAQKKAQTTALLSKKIKELMDTCSCRVTDSYGNDTGQSKCLPDHQCTTPARCPGGSCTGPAIGGACHAGAQDCCPTGVKDQIEHGPIDMSVAINTNIGNGGGGGVVGGGGGVVGGRTGVLGLDTFAIFRASASTIRNNISIAGRQIQANITAAGDGIQANITAAGDGIQANITAAGDGIQANITAASNGIQSSITAASNEIQGNITAAGNEIQGNITAAGNEIQGNIAGVNQQIRTALSAANNQIASALANANREIQTNITVAGNGIQSNITNVDNQIKAALSDANNQIKNAIAANSDRSVADNIINGILLSLRNKINTILDTASNAANVSTAIQINSIINNTQSQISSIVDNTASQIDSYINQLTTANSDCENFTAKYKGLDEFRSKFNNDFTTIKNNVEKQAGIIDKNTWDKLMLIDQLTYLKGKVASWTDDSKIKDDKNALNNAKTALGKCYLAIPYVDLIKNYKTATQQNRVVLVQKTFSDPITKKIIDASKYCQGFNYANSSCFKKCNDSCPDTSPSVISEYQGCPQCEQDDKACLEEQKTCIEDAYNSRPCIYGDAGWGNFKNCMSTCQSDCTNNCGSKYPMCSPEYAFCKNQCKNNGQCVLDNSDSCLFNTQNIKNCADNATDQGNINFCIDHSYLCKNGSDQYAGYSVCVNNASPYCSTYGYSASALYNHPECQKCAKPYDPPEKGAACYSPTAAPTDSCLTICPETAKCPATSTCPSCPCDKITPSIKLSVPDPAVTTPKARWTSTTISKNISEYQIVGPTCNEYSYNDDPLNFYCENAWWDNPNRDGLNKTPLGSNMLCPKSQEIPVGQTVDNALNWADNLPKGPELLVKNIQIMVDQLTKIGKAKDDTIVKDYCKCNAKLEIIDPKDPRKRTSSPICTTGCKYIENKVCSPGGTCTWVCNCVLEPCKGASCQQVINYLAELWNNYKQLKLDYIDFYMATLKEPRSDIIKQLDYSRQTTSSCSSKGNAVKAQTKLLNCTRAKDEILAPVNLDCYGQDLGLSTGKPLTDNWFCCEVWKK